MSATAYPSDATPAAAAAKPAVSAPQVYVEPQTFFDKNHFPAHQYEDRVQQHESVSLGMWAFLATEVLLFAGVFLTFFIYRSQYHGTWVGGAHQMDWKLGTLNTCVLLVSSLTMALAVRSAELYRPRAIVVYLIATILLAFVFFGVKAVEYHHEWSKGLFPWHNWNLPTGHGAHEATAGQWEPPMRMFMYLYFTMTGLHAFHMVGGVTMLAVIAIMASRGKFARNYHPVEMAGLYWHFIDIVWVFLFPTLYLLYG